MELLVAPAVLLPQSVSACLLASKLARPWWSSGPASEVSTEQTSGSLLHPSTAASHTLSSVSGLRWAAQRRP